MKVVEEFETLQGEGKYLGVPSYFIRTAGCNLRCVWKDLDGTLTKCDTPYTSFRPEKGYDLVPNAIMNDLQETNIEHIVITGGEPTIQDDLVQITNDFLDAGYKVTIETNGTRYRHMMEGAFMSISPKLSNSYHQEEDFHSRLHEKQNEFRDSLEKWTKYHNYQLKFVVNRKTDLPEIRLIQEEFAIPKERIYLMPQGIRQEQFKEKDWLFDKCLEFGYTYTPRLHIDLFGNRRGI